MRGKTHTDALDAQPVFGAGRWHNSTGWLLLALGSALICLSATVAFSASTATALTARFLLEPVTARGSPRPIFLARGRGFQVQVSATGAVLAFPPARTTPSRGFLTEAESGTKTRFAASTAAQPETLRVIFAGANPDAAGAGEQPLSTRINYFFGADPRGWRLGVPVYSRVRFRQIYPGIDLAYYGCEGHLEYDFVVAPGADPAAIQLQIDGANEARVEANGDLVLQVGQRTMRQPPPVVSQNVHGWTRSILGRYRLVSESPWTIGFDLGDYDPGLPLVIDPVLVYSVLLGGTGFDEAWAVALDSEGNTYVAGGTASTNLPVVNALYPTNAGGFSDAFVAKLDSTGTNLIYATYFGGQGDDAAWGIALDSAGNVCVAGFTASPDFPVTSGAWSTNLTDPYSSYNAFMLRLDSSGSNLLYSTFLGGESPDIGVGLAVDGGGSIYVTGYTYSDDFPVRGAASTHRGRKDGFVTKFAAPDFGLAYSQLIGGAGDDVAQAVAVDSFGRATITGLTASDDFPLASPIQAERAGGEDAFVARLDPDGAAWLSSTYLGGSGNDSALAAAADDAGGVFILGSTESDDFPVTNALFPERQGGTDAFLAKLDATGTNLAFATYLGGSLDDEGWGLGRDAAGNVIIAGTTYSTDFPTTNALQAAHVNLHDIFVACLDARGVQLRYSTYWGGSGNDELRNLAVAPDGTATFVGSTSSLDFPVLPGTNLWPVVYAGGGSDSYVARISPDDLKLGIGHMPPTQVSLRWAGPFLHYRPESTRELQSTNAWTVVTNVPVVIDDQNTVTLTNTSGAEFFRLRGRD